jgi:hypothetical protein
MEDQIKFIARTLAEEDPSMKKPAWKQVQDELEKYLKKTDHWRNKGKKLIDYYPVPARTAISSRISDDKIYTWSTDDDDWSLGRHTASGLADDSVGVCMEIWQWTLRQATFYPFSIRTARYVSKLRWVHNAGGSATGQIQSGKHENLYIIATQYAAHERHVEAVKDKRGMRSRILDAAIMLSADEKAVAERIGLMAEWGASDDYVALGLEFEEMAPEVFRHMQVQGQVTRGVINIDEPSRKVNLLLDRYGVQGSPRRVEIEGVWSMALRMLTRHPRWDELPQEVKYDVNVRLLQELCNVDARGEAGSWNPDFEKLIDEAEGRPDITKYEDVTDEMLSRYPEAIKEAWQQVMRIALDNEEYVALRDDDEHPGIEHYMDLALLKDLCRAYDSGASLVKLEEYEPAQRIAMVIRETRANYA